LISRLLEDAIHHGQRKAEKTAVSSFKDAGQQAGTVAVFENLPNAQQKGAGLAAATEDAEHARVSGAWELVEAEDSIETQQAG
jgi:hypothetical protein